MKKIAVILCFLLLLGGLTACKQDETNNPNSNIKNSRNVPKCNDQNQNLTQCKL